MQLGCRNFLGRILNLIRQLLDLHLMFVLQLINVTCVFLLFKLELVLSLNNLLGGRLLSFVNILLELVLCILQLPVCTFKFLGHLSKLPFESSNGRLTICHCLPQ